MKMTLEKFDEKVRQAENQRAAISKEIEALARQEAGLASECQAAIDSGNVDLYLEKSTEKERVSKTLFVKRSFLSKMGSPVKAEDAAEAWESYATAYNKEMLKALSEFASEREKLLKAYKALIEKQSAALKVRDHLSEVIGLSNPEKNFPMEFIPCLNDINAPGAVRFGNYNTSDPDLIYCFAGIEKAAKCNVKSPLNHDKEATKDVNHFFNVVVKHKAE